MSSRALVPSTYQPKDVGTFIEIDRGEEQLVGVQWRISEGIGHYCELVVGMPKIIVHVHRLFSALTRSSSKRESAHLQI